MLHPLEWEEDEALTLKRVPEPIAETVRGFRPRITILGMPTVETPPQPALELDWEDHEGITQKCTPFYDEPEEVPSWEDEATLPDLSALRGDEPQIAVKEVEVDPRDLTPMHYPPSYPPPMGSVPPMALDPNAPADGWSKAAAAGSALVLMALAALAVFLFVPRTGTLRIELDHRGAPAQRAEIYVDGQKRCDTDPCIVSDLEPGTRVIKVLIAGAQEAVESEGEVEPGETEVVTVRVAFVQGLRARARQRDVRLWVDGDERGTLPLELDDLAAGTHQLRFSAGERFAELTRSVEVPVGGVVDLGEIDLEVRSVALVIDLATADARVQLVDPHGKVSTIAGPFPATIELGPGRYRVVGSKPGYAPRAETIVLGKDPMHTLRLSLSPKRWQPIAPEPDIAPSESEPEISEPPPEVPPEPPAPQLERALQN